MTGSGQTMESNRPWWQRMFALPNVGSVAIGVITFLLLVRWWDTHLGAVGAGLVSALVTGLTWWAWFHLTKPPSIEAVLSSPRIGSIPQFLPGPTPTLVAADSDAAQSYRDAVEALEATTTGQVIMVSSPAPGQGATTVAMNLAIAATQAGRRVVLIDGDVETKGMSRFGSSGPEPGLTDLATGEVDLMAASRMWSIDERSSVPFIPAGSTREDGPEPLSGPHMADVIDRLSEGADLIIIDAAPILWNGASRHLATHADGTLLVVSPSADTGTLSRAYQGLAEAGAPVMGYVVNRAGRAAKPKARPALRMLKRSLATFLIVMAVFMSWNAAQLWSSWRSVERNQFDLVGAEVLLPLPAAGYSTDELDQNTATAVTAIPHTDGRFTTFLVIGTDSRANLDPSQIDEFGDFGGARADVIILVLLPTDGSEPMMVSIPRDLYIFNRCTGALTRVNANLAGCGDVNGPTLLALAVEGFTGIPVDHFALFDFEGFEKIIDELGGIEICVDNPVRDSKANLDLPEGCHVAGGAQVLAWVRSRHTQELVDGRWRTMAGVNDLTRNERQQDVIVAMFSKLRSFTSPSDLTGKVRSLANAFTLDDQLGLGDAINLAWSMRDIDLDGIVRLHIPVADHTAPDGAAVLVPVEPFDQILEAAGIDTSNAA